MSSKATLPQIEAVYIRSYVYNIIRVYVSKNNGNDNEGYSRITVNSNEETSESSTHALLWRSKDYETQAEHPPITSEAEMPVLHKFGQPMKIFAEKVNLKMMFALQTSATEWLTSKILKAAAKMGFLDLFCVASMPVLKVLLITALGSFLALDAIDILEKNTRKNVNRIVFYVFNPALVGSNLAKTITLESVIKLWFMPLNILVTFIVGSALGWFLVKILRVPQHLKGLVLGSCAAGNLGNLPIIITPAICREKGSPFGAPDVCHTNGLAYASLSMAIGAIYLWSYVYNIVRLSSRNIAKEVDTSKSNGNTKSICEISEGLQRDCTEPLLTPEDCTSMDSINEFTLPHRISDESDRGKVSLKLKQHLRQLPRKFNLKALLAPSTTGAVVGFIIGTVPQIRDLMIGASAPLRVVQDSASLLGDAAIPTITLIVGGNLLRGLKGSGVRLSIILGIITIRYIVLPLLGIMVVKGAIHFGLVQSDPLYHFVLLLQYALPPAMNIGTITQLFGAGESECSVILLWTYALASVSLTLWSTFFMWLVA